MESTRYHKVPQLELPDPDYFESQARAIERQGYLSDRLRVWARRCSWFILIALFSTVAILYNVNWLRTGPSLTGLRTVENAHLKLTGPSDGSRNPVQVDVSSPSATTLLPGAMNQTTLGTANNSTTTASQGKPSPTIHSDATQISTTTQTSDHSTTVPVSATPSSTALPNVLASPENKPKPPNTEAGKAQQDGGKVSVQGAPPPNQEPLIPIKATFYSGVEGPKACRGHVIAVINMPKARTFGIPTEPQCYNFPSLQSSGCAVLMGNKVDGCQASVYAEPDCRSYTNTVAFMAENRPVGGNWQSVKVQCGLPEPDPASLGKPPMMDSISGLVDHSKGQR